MSAEGESGPGRREIAYRLFAAEFDDASLSYSESDEERAPNYVVTPTGLRVNRLFAVGVLTEVETINEDTLRGRIVDPTGAFVTYAGQYQPEAQAFLDRTNPPAFVAITGKARTFEPEDSDRVFTSVRPESLSEVDSDTRDRWVVSAAESTLHRIAVCAAAVNSGLRGEELRAALEEAGVDDSLATGVPRALDHYDTTTAYLEALRQRAVEALELVADERGEVRSLDLSPGEGGEAALGPLPAVDIELAGEPTPATEPEPAATPETAEEDGETASQSTTEPAESAETTADTAGSETVDSTPETGDGGPDDTDVDTSTETVESTESGADTVESVEPDAEAENGASDSDAEADTASTADTDETVAAEESGMYQLDEEEREELESEYGSGFTSGNEVDPAGEADIDVPDVDELAEQAEADDAATEEAASVDTEPAADTETAADDETLGEFDDGLGDFEDEASESGTEPATDDEPTTEPDTEAEVESTAETGTEPATADDTETDDGTDVTDEPPAEDIDLEETVVETMAAMDDGDGVDHEELVTTVVDSYGVDETAVEEAIADALMGGRCYEPGDGVLKAI